MAEQRITRSTLGGLRPLGGPGDRSYEFISQMLDSALGPRHAALFAEPVPTQDGRIVDWVSPLLGTVQPFEKLPAAQAKALRDELRDMVAEIRSLIQRLEAAGDQDARRRAKALQNALVIPDVACLYRVGDQPVLIRWAYQREDAGPNDDILSQLISTEPVSKVVAEFVPDRKGVVVGRSASAGNVVLDHPGISQRHALYTVEDGGLVVRDLGSETGTFVNGVRLKGPQKVGPEDRVDIGPYRLDYDGESVEVDDRVSEAGLSLRNVTRDVKIAGQSEPLRILDDVTLDIDAGEFVCIIGPSGSGKSTLMNAMSGRVRPTSGQITFNDLDLNAHFDYLKQVIAMVPQHNLLHEPLTLRRALGYTARLRLPPDMSAGERAAMVDRAAGEVGLSERLDTRIDRLSGGQKKRCSLANELLDKPALLFLDEVTSGLDETTDLAIMALLKTMADKGMTIVCVTHTLANIEAYCDRLIVMDVGGVMAFTGSPAETLEFFGVQKLGEIFSRLPERKPSDWRSAFEAQHPRPSPQAEEKSTSVPPSQGFKPFAAISRGLRQTAVIAHRNLWLLGSDTQIWIMALVQSTLIGVLIGYAFSDFGPATAVTQSKVSLLLLLGLAGLWIGCSSASKDIVGELEIFQRESDVNLLTVAFVTSKFLVTASFTVIQVSIVFLLTYLVAQEIPGDPVLQWSFAVLAAVAGCCLGLLISAVTNTTEQATTVVPLMLVPQLILSGIIVPYLPEIARTLSETTVTSFVFVEAMKSVFIESDGPVLIADAETGQTVEMVARHYSEGAQLLVLHSIVALALTLQITSWRQILRRKQFG
ncbi:ATP-binding cassette domain-containing protein [Pelagibius sp. Alg239-R121]|uniref:ATP-binding cassette domain-containing protein n=1 Tax=Pelagibius sp. Alg239-R121 TaxID=2993448 RepID=UPI0024A693FF|nr:ATP-binding cassette domain-containing protein [Pelagibius sp. Alg239-R121]